MGQKVHPTGIRLGIVKRHTSTWFASKGDYANKLNTDLLVKEFITPEQFKKYETIGLEMGFMYVESGALVRSSYKAHKHAV